MKITLQEAFGKRNDIKREIEELKESAAKNLWCETEVPIDFEIGTIIAPSVAIKKTIELMDELSILNKKIYEANIANNDLLRSLETIGAKISFYEKIVSNMKLFPGTKARNPWFNKADSTSKEFINNSLNVTPAEINEALDSLKKEKRHVEESLRYNNYTLTIDL